MNFFKVLMLLNALSSKLAEALSDNELSLREISELIDLTMKNTLGYGLDNIAIQVKDANGKKEIKIVVKNS